MFDFTDEHLYEFCMDNRMYDEYNYQSDPEGDEPSAKITLDELGVVEKQKFSLRKSSNMSTGYQKSPHFSGD